MRIKLDKKHWLNSDQYSCWITCEVESKNKKSYEKQVSGYYWTVDQAINSYIDRKIMSSEVETLEELMAEVEALKNTVMGWKVALERGE